MNLQLRHPCIKLILAGLLLMSLLPHGKVPLANTNDAAIAIGLHHFPPYIIREQNGDLSGVIVDIIKSVFANAGVEVKLVYAPYSRAIALAESGKIDAIGMINSETTRELKLSAMHTCSLVQVFFTRTESDWHYEGVDSLKTLKVLTVSDYNYESISPAYQEYLNSSANVYHMAAAENFVSSIAKMLVARRVDVFNEDRASMNYALRQTGLSGRLREAGEFPKKLNQFVGFNRSKRGDEFRKVFDASFTELLASGKIAGILDRHGAFRAEN